MLRERIQRVMGLFQKDALYEFMKENDFVKEIVFFGSFIKGNEKKDSDLDIIIIPQPDFLSETNDMDRIETLLGVHDDLSTLLATSIPLDVKCRSFVMKMNNMVGHIEQVMHLQLLILL
jgi:predicted nucleotidyltransferase